MLNVTESSTTKSSNDLTIKFSIPSFKTVFNNSTYASKHWSVQSKPCSVCTEDGKVNWCLILGSHPVDKSNDDFFAKLRMTNSEPAYMKTFSITYYFGIMDTDNNIVFRTVLMKANSSDLVAFAGNEVHLFSKKRLIQQEKRWIVDESITFFCKIIIIAPTETMSAVAIYNQRLFEKATYADVKVITEKGKVIKAHKCILSRSPFFRALFQHEGDIREVPAHNVSYEVMKTLIFFIYTDIVNDLENIAGDLVLAADYYGMLDLKQKCIYSLEANVTFENFAQSFYIAERLGLTALREEVLRFVVSNRKTIRSSSGWEELKANKELYDVVFNAFLDTSI